MSKLPTEKDTNPVNWINMVIGWNARNQMEREAVHYALCEAKELLASELASWQARAEQAESTIAAWKKDAEDKAALIAELTARMSRAEQALLLIAENAEEQEPNPTWVAEMVRRTLSRSTDLEREDGKK